MPWDRARMLCCDVSIPAADDGRMQRDTGMARGAHPMARGGRRERQAHERRRTPSVEQRPSAQLTSEQRTQLDALVASGARLAAALRAAAPLGRPALVAVLSPIAQAQEPVAEAYAAQLGDVRGPEARDAADVAHALAELDARHEVARAARRARMRLGSAGVTPTLLMPATGGHAQLSVDAGEPESQPQPLPQPRQQPQTAPAHIHVQRSARLVEAYASRTRETGEMTLILAWQEGLNLDRLRAHIYTLSFWDAGIKHFAISEPMTRAGFADDVLATATREMQLIAVSREQAASLVREALSVNEWRSTAPAAEFQLNRNLIETRLLGEPDDTDAAGKAERCQPVKFAALRVRCGAS